MIPKPSWRWLFLVGVVVAITVVVLELPAQSGRTTRGVKLPGGGYARLERFEIQTNKVGYELPTQGLPRSLERAFPTWLKNRVGRIDWHLAGISDPEFPN